MKRRAKDWEVLLIRSILEYQFDERVADAVLSGGSILIETSGKGSIRNVYVGKRRMLTLRPNDGLFSISLDAASRILAVSEPPRFRVVVRGEREISGSVLVGDVVDMDPDLRPGDEVIVVDGMDNILAVGRLRLPRAMIEGLARGEVVRVRKKVKAK